MNAMPMVTICEVCPWRHSWVDSGPAAQCAASERARWHVFYAHPEERPVTLYTSELPAQPKTG